MVLSHCAAMPRSWVTDDEGLAVFVLEAEHFVEDMLGEIAVERAGGLVGEGSNPRASICIVRGRRAAVHRRRGS